MVEIFCLQVDGSAPGAMGAPEVRILTPDSVQLILRMPSDTGGMDVRYEVEQTVVGSGKWNTIDGPYRDESWHDDRTPSPHKP